MPLGQPWREGKRPYGPAALSTTASCLKGFYVHRAALGVNAEPGKALDRARLPSRADRRRRFLGHTTTTLPANPLAPHGPRRRHPKMLPGGAKERLLETVRSARDRLAVTWLSDAGPADRRVVRAAPGRLAPTRRRCLRAVPHPAPACLPPTGQPEPRRCEDQTPLAGRGRHRNWWAHQAGQPGDDPHLLRLHHHRIPVRQNRSRDAAGAAARRSGGTAVGAGGGAADARLWELGGAIPPGPPDQTGSSPASAPRIGTPSLTVSPLGNLPLAAIDGSIGTRLLTFRAGAADQAHVACMPGTTWPVNGHPPGSSRDYPPAPVLMPANLFRHVNGCNARLPDPRLTRAPGLFPHRSPRQSSTNAAVGGLKPPPAGRLRRADNPSSPAQHRPAAHLSRSLRRS